MSEIAELRAVVADLSVRLAAQEERRRDEDLAAIRSDLQYVRQATFKLAIDTQTGFSGIGQVLDAVVRTMVTKDDLSEVRDQVKMIVAWIERQP